jgi:accessory colonization factor AcfC
MNTSEYNGWTNYQTWAVSLWMDNTQGDQQYWAEITKEVVERAQADAIFTAAERAAFDLTEKMKDHFEENMPEIGGVYADLLGSALSDVNWREIAQHLVKQVTNE